MVKLRIISDIHFDGGLNGLAKNTRKTYNHSPFGSYFGKNLKKEKNCVTLIAGDLASSINNTQGFLEYFFPNQPVFFVMGNHDGIYQVTDKTIYELKEEWTNTFSKDHLFWHCLENNWMWIPGTNDQVAIIGSTFYTNYEYTTFTVDSFNEYKKRWDTLLQLYGFCGKDDNYKPIKKLTKRKIISENLLLASERLNDFQWGKETKYTKLTPETYLKLHNIAKEQILRCYNEILAINKNAKVILMTHHCLSPKCIDEKYTNSLSNASYVSDLEKWLCKEMPNLRLIISGHVHCRKDFIFGKDKKRYIINACGYIPRNEPFNKPKFNPNFIIDTEEL